LRSLFGLQIEAHSELVGVVAEGHAVRISEITSVHGADKGTVEEDFDVHEALLACR
jgi:hypothetical protein